VETFQEDQGVFVVDSKRVCAFFWGGGGGDIIITQSMVNELIISSLLIDMRFSGDKYSKRIVAGRPPITLILHAIEESVSKSLNLDFKIPRVT